MRAVIQRVRHAAVHIGGAERAAIHEGLLVFLGIEEPDTEADTAWLSSKIVHLRIFDDAAGVPNVSVKETGGNILLISQFTLFAATKKGNRPGYSRAARPDIAEPLYEKMIAQLETDLGKPVFTGVFGADMQVSLLNNGPVTIWMDTRNKE